MMICKESQAGDPITWSISMTKDVIFLSEYQYIIILDTTYPLFLASSTIFFHIKSVDSKSVNFYHNLNLKFELEIYTIG